MTSVISEASEKDYNQNLKPKNKTMFQVNVTIGFNPETLAVLTALLASMPKTAKAPAAERPSTANGKALKVAEPVKEPVINGEASEEQEEGAVTTQVVTAEQVRAAVVATKQKLGNDTGIKGLLAEFGAVDSIGKTKLTELKAADYAEFLTRLEALK